MGVSPINTACIAERTSLQWFGERTPVINKASGIKQGCPLSPRLFILLLHHVLITLRELMPEINVEHYGHIIIPCILAYADDLLFVCDTDEDVERIIGLLITLLASVGLEINTSKPCVLYRNPCDINNVEPDSMRKLGPFELKVVTKLGYLGAFVTSSLTRKETTAERIKKANKVFHAVCGFLRRYKLKWEVVERLYNSCISPVPRYSMEVSTLLKSNRNALSDMENSMLEILLSLSSDGEQIRNDIRNEQRLAQTEEEENSEETDQQEQISLEQIAPKILKGKTINNQIGIARPNFYGNILRGGNESILRTALKYRIDEPKKLGRPAFTWRTMIREDIERSGINAEQWQDWALNKEKLKREAKNLLNTMVESDYEVSSASEEDSEIDMLPSEFEGFDEESQECSGFEEM
ncbi:uncharacterized protein LOC131686261 [Topomyia yanbarensis]|uniref:uncharacterized protein LOC131686261 n=1 Tax=Topomyia yanbarensis TaxID=2498891 RepID=UPI00273CB568|nr:uncharacterized protein LOC131686261 [Topomyia yanbarensis]